VFVASLLLSLTQAFLAPAFVGFTEYLLSLLAPGTSALFASQHGIPSTLTLESLTSESATNESYLSPLSSCGSAHFHSPWAYTPDSHFGTAAHAFSAPFHFPISSFLFPLSASLWLCGLFLPSPHRLSRATSTITMPFAATALPHSDAAKLSHDHFAYLYWPLRKDSSVPNESC
jgi:hypothetical protein